MFALAVTLPHVVDHLFAFAFTKALVEIPQDDSTVAVSEDPDRDRGRGTGEHWTRAYYAFLELGSLEEDWAVIQ